MSLSQEKLRALQCLFGTAAEPLCIVDRGLRVLWQPDERASCLLPLLMAALQTGGESPLLPKNDVMYLHEGSRTLQCCIDMLPDTEQSAYLIRFYQCDVPIAGQNAACAALSACAEEIRLTVSELLQLLADVYEVMRSSRKAEGMADVPDQMLAACYRLLNQSLRCAEYAWYEAADAATPVSYGIVDAGRALCELAETLRQIAGDVLVFDEQEAAYGVNICTDSERLYFALLSAFLMTQRGQAADSVIHMRAERRGKMAELCIEARRVSDRTVPRRHPAMSLPTDATVLSAEALARRFCKQFGGTLQYNENKQGCAVLLRLPYADAPAAITFESPRPVRIPGRYSLYRIMLSSVIDFRYDDAD